MEEKENFPPKRRGRPPKVKAEFAELAKTKSVDALKKLMSIAKNKDAKPETVIKACETVMAYGYGKPGLTKESKEKSDMKVVIDYKG